MLSDFDRSDGTARYLQQKLWNSGHLQWQVICGWQPSQQLHSEERMDH